MAAAPNAKMCPLVMDEKLLHCFFWRPVVSRPKQRRSEHHQTSALADAPVPEKPIQTVIMYPSKETSARLPQSPLSDTLSSDDAPCVPRKNFTVFRMLCSDNHPTCLRKHNWESGGEK